MVICQVKMSRASLSLSTDEEGEEGEEGKKELKEVKEVKLLLVKE
ncbi:MAG: hypothetical protein CM15mP102_13710 [Flavobacteriales bacterium]|nr:MAG: hypothetical protein CM15mP102_13710 [Flavobacteriales bacterium]